MAGTKLGWQYRPVSLLFLGPDAGRPITCPRAGERESLSPNRVSNRPSCLIPGPLTFFSHEEEGEKGENVPIFASDILPLR